jgi:murein DD-endopeptidase MepM/ murein hydrolase activator NlpD
MKNKIISILVILILSVSIFLVGFANKNYSKAKEVYQVYLNGNKIGMIANDEDLYDLINERQKEIKKKYNVKNVYPPNGFDIVKSYTYEDMVNDVDEIYNQIEKEDDFTIKGYTITIHKTEKDEETGKVPDDIVIHVLNKKVFNEAIKRFVYSFIGKDAYNNYLNNSQPEIKDVGKIIQKMYFSENITIKEDNISVKEKIYTDATQLSQYLLFGSDIKQEEYTIKTGDTIPKISENHKLNPEEFLIANPKYRDENSLLTIGDNVSIALINPQLSLVTEMYVVEDVEQYFEKQTVYDEKKPYGYSKVTQQGVNGITRFTETYKSVNGEPGAANVLKKEVLREKVNQITTKGKKVNYGSISGNFIDTGGTWAWPTNSGYKITSNYAWRWGKLHAALDIAWLPRRSPIYAAGDGVVVTATRGSGSGWSLGNYVVIKHDNNIYTQYAHMDVISVSAGQTVKKGQVLGGMGDTGRATGVHLHFAAFHGMPYQGGQPFNPMQLYR